MEKIRTLFQRGSDRFVTEKLEPGLEWVLAGEGVATRKFDGICVGVDDGRIFTRQEWKPPKPKPEGWVQSGAIDLATGGVPGWVPYKASGFAKLIEQSVLHARSLGVLVDGTYELVGPKINGNAEGYNRHHLVRHGVEVLADVDDLSFDGLKDYLLAHPFEGIVWWRRPGDRQAGLAKLKRRDFVR